MAGIGLESLHPEVVKSGIEDVKTTRQIICQKYIAAFTRVKNEMLLCYNNVTENMLQTQNILELQEQSAYNKVVELYDTWKGGAKILPFKDKFDELKKNKQNKEQLMKIRDSVYQLKENANIQQAAGRMTALIYALKQELTNKEEQFAFIYNGAEKNSTEVIKVPVQNILLNSTIMNSMTLEATSIMRWNLRDQRSLRFNTSVLQQLKNNYTPSSLDEVSGDNFMEMYNNLKTLGYYKTLKTYKKEKNAIKYKEKHGGILRQDVKGNYLVVEEKMTPYEGGFIVQGLFGLLYEDPNATFIGDSRTFYKTADTIIGDTAFSVKSFVDNQLPSLVSIDTLFRACDKIINILNSSNTSQMDTQLKSFFDLPVKTALQHMEDVATQDIETVFEKWAMTF